jgi:hypothetical protein
MSFVRNLIRNRFVVEDARYNYVSARYPGDAEKLAERLVELVKDNMEHNIKA